jgi:hypothetical protein
MKLVREQRGYSIAVYPPASKKKASAKKLLKDRRVNFVAPANYKKEGRLDLQVRAIINKIMLEYELARRERP